jgi:hypothetical protein
MADRELLAAIGEALGLGRPYQEKPGWPRLAVLGGTVDDGRVAWVEATAGVSGRAATAVSVTVHVAGRNLPHRCLELETDDPSSGLRVGFLRFFADVLVLVYSEKHRRILSRLTLDTGEQTIVDLDEFTLMRPPPADGVVIVGDLLLSRELDNRLVHMLRLPHLQPCLPLPAGTYRLDIQSPDGTLLHWTDTGTQTDLGDSAPQRRVWWLRLPSADQYGVPDNIADLFARVRTLLAGPDVPQDGLDIMIGAVTPPYWRPLVKSVSGPADWRDPPCPCPPNRGEPQLYDRLPKRSTRYQDAAAWWFPAGYYHYLRANQHHGGAGHPEQAARWLAWLDRLATQSPIDQPAGWQPEWSLQEGAAQLAATAIRLHAGPLATACRAGTLPGRWPNATKSIPALPLRFPRGFRRAWGHLPPRFRPDGFRNSQ